MRRWLTKSVFLDLAIAMAVFGLFIGLVFPFAVTAIGVPSRYAIKISFFFWTILAGLGVAAFCSLIAKAVVGTRVKMLAGAIGKVTSMIEALKYSDDGAACTPESCFVAAGTNDALGHLAQEFNTMVQQLMEKNQAETALGGLTKTLSEHLVLEDLADNVLESSMLFSKAGAGAICIARDGELVIQASQDLVIKDTSSWASCRRALSSDSVVVVDIPDDVVVEANVASFRPRQVVIAPAIFRSTPMGALILAFGETVPQDLLRLLDAVRKPLAVAINNSLNHEKFQLLAAIDPLTGVYNRRFGFARLSEEFSRSIRSHAPLGLLSFDIDHFKAVNDTFGHLAGDKVLLAVSAAAANCLREGDILVRSGGEEFLVVIPGANSADAERIAERIRRSVEVMAVETTEGLVSVTVSLGAVSIPEVDVLDTQEMIALVDKALYTSKGSGRNKTTVVTSHKSSSAEANGRKGSLAGLS